MFLTIFCIVIAIGSSARAVPLYEQCGGEGYRGSTQCDAGLRCLSRSQWFSSCQVSCPPDWECREESGASNSGQSAVALELEQCGGEGHRGATECPSGFKCYARSVWYSQCRPSCPRDWLCRLTSSVDSFEEAETSTSFHTTNIIDNLIEESVEDHDYGDYMVRADYELDEEDILDCDELSVLLPLTAIICEYLEGLG